MTWAGRPHRTRALAAFTLVELLVVVGIIAILIAFLMPSLQRARKSAVRLQCVSNLRQQGVAIFTYVNENNGNLPVGGTTDGNYNSSHYFEQQDYLVQRYTHGDGRIWCCPEINYYGDTPQTLTRWTFWAENLGGGYQHWMPCFYALSPYVGYIIIADPRTWQLNSPFFKEHLPTLPILASNNQPFLVSKNKLTAAKGRWMIKSEYYPPRIPFPNSEAFGGWRHLGRDGTPEGGSILFSDGSATWSRRIEWWWAASGQPGTTWPENLSPNGAN